MAPAVQGLDVQLAPTLLSAETLVICGAKPAGPGISPHVVAHSREKGWAVVSEFPVSIGDAP